VADDKPSRHRRRGAGEGSVRRRGTGWEARLTYTDPDGQRQRTSFYAATAAAARAKMTAARARIDAGAPVRDATRTVGDWVNHWCATTLAVSSRKESTKSLYAGLAKSHIVPAPFGAITLDRLRPSDVERLILTLRDRGLSPSTVRMVYSALRLALDGAVRDQLLARNPAAAVVRPGVPRREARHLGADEVVAVLRAAEKSRYHPALTLIASTGLRRGECLALSWDHVDLDAGALKVTATIARINNQLLISEPKSERSRRTVPLAPEVAAMLKRHRTQQKSERLRAGERWTDSGLVFTTRLGAPVEPRHLVAALKTAAGKAGIADVTVHTLRHSAAMGWLENGVHIKAVADLLGHSSIAITGDVYGHTSDDTARAAVDGLAGRLGLSFP
jgi:integrase